MNGNKRCKKKKKKKKKPSIQTQIGNFYYTVMSFSLTNAGGTYQHTMIVIFHNMMQQEMEDYVDDIVEESKARRDTFRSLNKFLNDVECTSHA